MFFKGLRNLFKQNVNKTVTYKDFCNIYNCLAEERDMKVNVIDYIHPFLTKNGVNELSVNMSVNEDKIEKCSIKQTCTNLNDVYYNFNTNILLIYENSTEEELKEINILNSTENELKELVGKNQPAVILLNSGDYCYFKQNFSAKEVEFLMKNTNVIFLFSFL